VATLSIAHAANAPLKLWYDAPATDWETQALPIGTGALGAMIFGGIAEDRVQFNEKTLWTGGPGSKSGYDFGIPDSSLAPSVKAVASELDQKQQLAPEDVAKRIGRKPRGYGDYQSAGDLLLDFGSNTRAVTAYRRELDLHRGIARVSYTHDGSAFTREYFASYPDQVIVIRLSSEREGQIGFRLKLPTPDNRSRSVRIDNGRMSVSGALHDNGLRYELAVHVLADGGNVVSRREHIEVTAANSVVILLTAATDYALSYPDYRGAEPHGVVHRRLDLAVKLGEPALRQRHLADYDALFKRVTLDLSSSSSREPTDRLLRTYGTGDATADRMLEELYFQYGRYLLIASSRAGSLPANLQGVWNHSATPPWNADYHVNINLQMNYWPTQTTHLAETATPFFDFVDHLRVPGRVAAEKITGSRGWTLFLNTNVWGFTGLIEWPTAFWQPESAAWLAQHYYEHYLFSGDTRFLRERAWPVMQGAAEYWLSTLHTDPRDQSLVVSPSYSPEHGPFTAGAAMSQQIVADLFQNTIQAAETIGEHAFASQVRAALAKLDPGLKIGGWEQLQEWKVELDDPKTDHRHVSHLFALHPGRSISPLTTPELAKAARVSLEARGDGGTGWSKAWKINFWARLHAGDRAHKLLGEQLKSSTLPNLLDTHPPFQIDGNFGATAGIAEMLLQSHLGEIHLLPALPKAWSNGSFKGLRARGDVTVDASWRDEELEQAVLHANRTGELSVRSSIFAGPYALIDRSTSDAVRSRGGRDRRTFSARAGNSYLLRKQQK
jgi:alpha-L-fucosidase 2